MIAQLADQDCHVSQSMRSTVSISWKHFPGIVPYPSYRGLANHGNDSLIVI